MNVLQSCKTSVGSCEHESYCRLVRHLSSRESRRGRDAPVDLEKTLQDRGRNQRERGRIFAKVLQRLSY